MTAPRATGAPVWLLAALLGGLVAASTHAQDPEGEEAQATAQPTAEPETFGRDVELVRVDVVVTKDGKPVTDLGRDDFVLLDEGEPQTLETFEAVHLPVPEQETGSPPRARIATNEKKPDDSDSSRTVVIVFDDLNLTMESAPRAKAAVALLIDQALRPGDRVTLVATGGGTWWSTTMPEGRADLLAILKGLDGRRVRTDVRDAITDFEAMRIYMFNDSLIADRVLRRFETYGVTSRVESQQDRETREIYQRGIIDPYVMRRATEEYLKARTRNRASLGAIERTLVPLAATRERKTVILASDGFVYDTQEKGFDRVREAARRANAVIHFLDTRGLQAPGLYSAQFAAAPGDASSTLAVLADSSLDAEGSEALAIDTGGYAIRNTNDLTDGVERIAVESRSYYLLGFTPDVPRDGRYRKIEVKTRRNGLDVRARKGYYAPSDPTVAKGSKPPKKDADFQEALDAARFFDDIPLRMTVYVLDERTTGLARVLVVADVDVNEVEFDEKEGQRLAALDVLLVVAQRGTGEFIRNDQRVDLARKPGAKSPSPWYTLVREFELKPGGHQAKIVVRDAATRRMGSLSYDFEVPPLDEFRVAPVLTDLIQQTSEGIGPVVVARRTFETHRPLYCRFDVYGATRENGGEPRVSAAHELRRKSDGTVLERSALTPILPTSIGAVARLMQIPLNVDPGVYELDLTVRDDVTGKTVEVREPFVAR